MDLIPTIPRAAREDGTRILHGYSLYDPYEWIEDRRREDVQEYLQQENQYAEHLSGQSRYRARLNRSAFVDRSPVFESLEYVSGEFAYFLKQRPGEPSPRFYRQRLSPQRGRLELLLDPQEFEEGRLGKVAVGREHRYLGYSLDTTGAGVYTLYVRDLETDALVDQLPGVSRDFAWFGESGEIFYLVNDSSGAAKRLMRHKLGTEWNEDTTVYIENDDEFSLSLKLSESGRFLFLTSSSPITSEVFVVEREGDRFRARSLFGRRSGVIRKVTHQGDYFVWLSNENNSGYDLLRVPLISSNSEPEILLRGAESERLQDLIAFSKATMVFGWSRGEYRAQIVRAPGDVQQLSLPDEMSSFVPRHDLPYESAHTGIFASSLVRAPAYFEYNLENGKLINVQQARYSHSSKLEHYRTRTLQIPARDGEFIPVTIAEKMGSKTHGQPRPAIFSGLGSFGQMPDLSFHPALLALLEQGVRYCVVHVRGGGEFGREWHSSGSGLRKQTSFSDMVDAVRGLIDRGVVDPRRLAAIGKGYGGLLVGGAMNLEPALFQAVVLVDPFLDVIAASAAYRGQQRQQLISEWGDLSDLRTFEYIRSYSPYERIAAVEYPAIRMRVRYHATGIDYWHGAKFVAQLRERKIGAQPLVLLTDFQETFDRSHEENREVAAQIEDYEFLLQWLDDV